MSPWAAFYRDRIGCPEYEDYVAERYKPFLDAVASRISFGRIVTEIGCGTGIITKLLAQRYAHASYIASDIDGEMLEIAERVRGVMPYHITTKDAKDTRKAADVVHSHGLLEHFDNHHIHAIISANRHAAQVHYVPGKYEAPSFGDERLMDVDSWWRICKPDQILTFNEGLDYALIFEAKRP